MIVREDDLLKKRSKYEKTGECDTGHQAERVIPSFISQCEKNCSTSYLGQEESIRCEGVGCSSELFYITQFILGARCLWRAGFMFFRGLSLFLKTVLLRTRCPAGTNPTKQVLLLFYLTFCKLVRKISLDGAVSSFEAVTLFYLSLIFLQLLNLILALHNFSTMYTLEKMDYFLQAIYDVLTFSCLMWHNSSEKK